MCPHAEPHLILIRSVYDSVATCDARNSRHAATSRESTGLFLHVVIARRGATCARRRVLPLPLLIHI